jgi:hypothetical protein
MVDIGAIADEAIELSGLSMMIDRHRPCDQNSDAYGRERNY